MTSKNNQKLSFSCREESCHQQVIKAKKAILARFLLGSNVVLLYFPYNWAVTCSVLVGTRGSDVSGFELLNLHLIKTKMMKRKDSLCCRPLALIKKSADSSFSGNLNLNFLVQRSVLYFSFFYTVSSTRLPAHLALFCIFNFEKLLTLIRLIWAFKDRYRYIEGGMENLSSKHCMIAKTFETDVKRFCIT